MVVKKSSSSVEEKMDGGVEKLVVVLKNRQRCYITGSGVEKRVVVNNGWWC